ncbi:hypothetical protein [Arenimonas sp. GDDSR-1]|uniref:hypothetical protein n=1 Tax=Arenimonas sp. GDDSR-1 TaxID=2950125 RepID=UPI002633F24D|nr:hypothetical protein [Arenimonas sp. GDDSR-1]
MGKPTFFSEMKRRQIYRGGVMYIVAGWVMVQVATSVFPYFNVPPWAVRYLVVSILLGFPVSLVCLWMFESVDPNDPEKHLHDRRQSREESASLTKMMEAERAQRQKDNQELIAALAQLKAGGPEAPAVAAPAAAASIPAAQPAPEPAPSAPPRKRKSLMTMFATAFAIALVLAGIWILLGPKDAHQASAVTGEITQKYVAPGFAQVESMGVALLTPLLDKLGIPIAPQRVFTALLVLFSLMVLRDLYRQIKQSARRRAQAP